MSGEIKTHRNVVLRKILLPFGSNRFRDKDQVGVRTHELLTGNSYLFSS